MILYALMLLGAAQAVPIDRFDRVEVWQAAASDGVMSRVSQTPGADGAALRLEYDFGDVSGYAFAGRALPIDWPDNYALRLRVRGTGGVNDLQIKFTDASGDNVWWHQRVDFRPSDEWQEIRIRPRDIEFAWGPTADKTLRRSERVEFVIVRGRDGGGGAIEIEGLTFEALPPPAPLPPVRASDPRAIDGNAATAWDARGGRALTLDFGGLRELSGVTIDWAGDAPAYRIETSDDGRVWTTARRVTDSDGGNDPIALPGTETRWLRVMAERGGKRARLNEIVVHDADWAATPNAFVGRLAGAAPRGAFPRGFVEQGYWTLVGTDGGATTALIGEDGAVEPAKGSYSVEPLLSVDGERFDWANVRATPSLAEDSLPIAATTWQGAGWTLESMAFADPADAALLARWRIANTGKRARRFRLTLAVRPFQVNPPAQFLAQRGGVSPIAALAWDGTTMRITQPGAIEGDAPTIRALTPLVAPTRVGMAAFDRGGLSGTAALPDAVRVEDPAALAQGALVYEVTLQPGEVFDVPVAFGEQPPAGFDARLAAARAFWNDRLGQVAMRVPAAKQAVADTVRTALAHVLISRDGPALKPGTRSYNRSWIRDGAMMSDTLLRLGVPGPAEAFADWYGQHLFANGKVPCCVDFRGADPVPENDSHGQYIHLLAQLHRYTGDTARLERDWPKLDAARRYMEGLRQSERTAANRTPDRRMLYGLMPPSISHEGYSEKAQYSLWDDFWALAGYDAAEHIARALKRPEAGEIATQRDEFATDILAAIEASARHWKIDHVPGATSLGDFDATSTTMALEITRLQDRLNPALLANTFDRQWARVMGRRQAGADWKDYTPYELRNVSAFVRLGQRGRANDLLDFYMADRRPAAWNGWAEVVGRDPREIRFIGDMPHAWVASDFIRAALDLFAYERSADRSIVLGSGLAPDWLTGQGSAIEGLRTPYGTIDLAMRGTADRLEVTLGGSAAPPGGFVLPWPFDGKPGRAMIDGAPADFGKDGLRFPAKPGGVRVIVAR
jgi:hypothetical protein